MAGKVSTTLFSRRFKMGWAALIMGVSVLLSRVMGLIRDKVISFLFGATQESDLYFAAFVIPDFLNYLLAGGYFSITLIPLLADYFGEDEKSGWSFFSAAFTWVTMGVTILTVSAMLLSPYFSRLVAPGLDDAAFSRLAFFLRIVMPAQIFFIMGSALTAVLFLRKQFLVPALTPLVYNLFIILGGVFMHHRGMEGFCWGVLAGAFLGNFLLPLMAVKRGGLQLRVVFFHPGLKRFFLLALPLMIGQSIVVLDEQLVRVFGSLAGTGAISWLNYARRIMMVPVGVVAQAAGVASYPFLAELVAKKDFSAFHETLNLALRSVLTVLIPVSAWMMVVARPTTVLIFQQGHFTASDAEHTAGLLQILLTAVFCWGAQQVLGRGYYARQDTLTPAIVGTAVTVISVPLFWALGNRFFATGVATASAAAIVLYTAALSCVWWYRFGSCAFAGLQTVFIKIGAISFAAAMPSFLLMRIEIIDSVHHPYIEALVEILASGVVFGMLFLGLSIALVPSLIRPLLERFGPFRRYFNR